MRRVALVTLVVDDHDEAIRHYTEALGFRPVEDTPRPDGSRWVVVAPEGNGAGTALLPARARNGRQRARVGDETGGRVGFFLLHRRLRPRPRPDAGGGRDLPGGAAARAVRHRRRLRGPVRQSLGPAPARHPLTSANRPRRRP
ncbi:extradiol dioxygenase [Streptomyces sp. F-3]|nr:extradiol dioxygenase [Streptomyces sp. F-3]